MTGRLTGDGGGGGSCRDDGGAADVVGDGVGGGEDGGSGGGGGEDGGGGSQQRQPHPAASQLASGSPIATATAGAPMTRHNTGRRAPARPATPRPVPVPSKSIRTVCAPWSMSCRAYPIASIPDAGGASQPDAASSAETAATAATTPIIAAQRARTPVKPAFPAPR